MLRYRKAYLFVILLYLLIFSQQIMAEHFIWFDDFEVGFLKTKGLSITNKNLNSDNFNFTGDYVSFAIFMDFRKLQIKTRIRYATNSYLMKDQETGDIENIKRSSIILMDFEYQPELYSYKRYDFYGHIAFQWQYYDFYNDQTVRLVLEYNCVCLGFSTRYTIKKFDPVIGNNEFMGRIYSTLIYSHSFSKYPMEYLGIKFNSHIYSGIYATLGFYFLHQDKLFKSIGFFVGATGFELFK